MRAVVTGGAGFIGSHLIEALLARGDEVICVERPGATRRWVEGLPIRLVDSGLGDVDVLTRLLEGIDIVYHLAGATQAPAAADYYQVNTEGTARVTRAMARQQHTRPRLVFLSSLAAVGPNRSGELIGPA